MNDPTQGVISVEQDNGKDVSIRLQWDTICKLACTAMIYKTSFNDACIMAMKARLDKMDGRDLQNLLS